MLWEHKGPAETSFWMVGLWRIAPNQTGLPRLRWWILVPDIDGFCSRWGLDLEVDGVLCSMKTWPFTMYHPLTWPCQDLGAARHVVLTTSKFQLYNSSQVELLALLCKENQWVAWDYRIRSWKQVSVGTSWCFHLEVIDWIRCMQTSEQM